MLKRPQFSVEPSEWQVKPWDPVQLLSTGEPLSSYQRCQRLPGSWVFLDANEFLKSAANHRIHHSLSAEKSLVPGSCCGLMWLVPEGFLSWRRGLCVEVVGPLRGGALWGLTGGSSLRRD
jgi:hypothetical protein